ncbi:MAG TPA: redoxin domain-containing protein [Bacillus bacterium]|nr:redoxin domain-containing protein [Bacillus sp. (in: firmicutes)]
MLNDAIMLGPFLIKYHYLFLFISWWIAYIIMRNRLKSNAPLREFILKQISNSSILWIVIWKCSYIIFNPAKVIANPQTILFFSGGQKGVILATIVSTVFFIVKLREHWMMKKAIVDGIIVGGLSFFITFNTVALIFGDDVRSSFVTLFVCLALFFVYINVAQLNSNQQERKEAMKKAIALLVFIGLIGYTIYTTAFSEKTAIVGLEKGNLAPDFELVTLTGEKVKLSDYRGKKVLLNFWASWCGPCRAEMPDMQELHEEGRKDFVILAVNATQTEASNESAIKFIKEFGLTFPIAFDEKGTVVKTYQVIALPTSYFIDSEGKINDKHTGTLSYEQMLNGIKKLD